jgi:hypothetical protein
MGKSEAYQDLVGVFKQNIDDLKNKTVELEKENHEQKEILRQNEERSAQIFKKILERIESDAAARKNGTLPYNLAADIPAADSMENFDLLHGPRDVPPYKEKKKDKLLSESSRSLSPRPSTAKVRGGKGSTGALRVDGNEFLFEQPVSEADEEASISSSDPDLLRSRVGGKAEGKSKRRTSRTELSRLLHDSRTETENVPFLNPSGYWSNTYIPGDPIFRALFSKIQQRHQDYRTDSLLDRLSLRPEQPFDAPQNAAIATFIHSDTVAIEGTSRMLVQVGVRGSDRHAGARPAMNVALVLDLTGDVKSTVARNIRALIDGFQHARDIGDKFSLVVAGTAGGVLVTPEDFRHGPIQIALKKVLEGSSRDREFTLEQAFGEASRIVRAEDDSSAPLGSSAIILVTPRNLDSEVSRLHQLAHNSAVAGIPVSTVGVKGGEAEFSGLTHLERIALAGQGRRRLFTSPADGERIASAELQAVSEVVARALRLRIKLAPGVKLVRVFGSHRLDEVRSQQVKAAEKSIDLRLSRNLGIEADRGEDEEGIQIVIPAFYAGDSHTILLDVVASTPGPVADVTAKYKDLVHLRNGISRSTLSIGRIHRAFGPLEMNVIKNYLAHRLSETLQQAGATLRIATPGSQSPIHTQSILQSYLTLQNEVMQQHRGLQRDQDLTRDTRMLTQYLNALDTSKSRKNPDYQFLAESLQLAGSLKVTPRPVSID